MGESSVVVCTGIDLCFDYNHFHNRISVRGKRWAFVEKEFP
jgi:hypothetical protein